MPKKKEKTGPNSDRKHHIPVDYNLAHSTPATKKAINSMLIIILKIVLNIYIIS